MAPAARDLPLASGSGRAALARFCTALRDITLVEHDRPLVLVVAHGGVLNLLVRALAEDRPRVGSVRSLRAWAESRDLELREGTAPGTLELVVAEGPSVPHDAP